MNIGIFSRTFETADLEETYKRMIEHDIYHAQFNLSNAGMPTLPEYLDEEKIEEIKNITDGYNIKLEEYKEKCSYYSNTGCSRRKWWSFKKT